MKTWKPHSALLLIFAILLLAPAVTSAADRIRWMGQGPGGHRMIYVNTTGDNWTERLQKGREECSHPCVEVKRNADFIELVSEDDGIELRVRLYKDKVLWWRSGQWRKVAEGAWKD